MPKTLFQNVIFTLMMSFLMVYVMICYNICLNVGGMSNEVFLMAFGELKIMWPVAFVLEFVFVDKLAYASCVLAWVLLQRFCSRTQEVMWLLPGVRQHSWTSRLLSSGRSSTADHSSVWSSERCFLRKKTLPLPL